MSTQSSPTALARYSGFFLFLLMTVACFVWFAWSAYDIVDSISSKALAVYFDKGSLYMLGAGIGLASLTFAIFYEGVLRRSLTSKITRGITRSALMGVSLMFILPHVLHYLTGTYLEEERYVVCDEVSYQWLLYKKLVFTSNQDACKNLAKEKEITKSSSGH
ncbi:MAG: hypothetical protein P8176_02665 [Gammaproteobacteria bacterium]